MEEDKGLELSLGLACGLTTSASNDRSDNSADDRTDADERTSKILNDFRNFLNAGAPQSFQRTDPVIPQENFFNHIQRTTSEVDDLANGAGTSENKRKSSFDDTNNSKKHETESHSSDVNGKEKNSHISITTDEGSTGDNEDVVESEAEESTSRMVSHHDDGSRTPGGSASSFQAPKETNGLTNISASSLSVPFSITINESCSVSAPSSSMYPISMHNIPLTNGDRLLPHTGSTKSVPVPFSHSLIPIPHKSNPWGIGRPTLPYSAYAGRSTPMSVSMPVTNPTEAAQSNGGPPHHLEGDGAHVGARPNSFPSEYPAIKPGIASEVKFGGSGKRPNLPWISTMGPGPNGKTISGVTYKYNATQIKIVCACHGIHLSPEEFVRHATEEQPSAITSTGLVSPSSSNPATTSA